MVATRRLLLCARVSRGIATQWRLRGLALLALAGYGALGCARGLAVGSSAAPSGVEPAPPRAAARAHPAAGTSLAPAPATSVPVTSVPVTSVPLAHASALVDVERGALEPELDAGTGAREGAASGADGVRATEVEPLPVEDADEEPPASQGTDAGVPATGAGPPGAAVASERGRAADAAGALPSGATTPDPSLFAFRTTAPLRLLDAGAPAMHAANLSPAACRAELSKAGLPFERAAGPAPGVADPLRVAGPIHGVQFVTPGKKSVYGKLDCRLALVLAPLADVLKQYAVVKVLVDNLYRPHAHLPGRRVRSQHSYGLAMDVMGFELEDGSRLLVERDFGADLGRPACGPGTTLPLLTEPAVKLRNLVCAVMRAGLFHHVLTPNFNRAHHNHFHFDIKRGDRRSLVE